MAASSEAVITRPFTQPWQPSLVPARSSNLYVVSAAAAICLLILLPVFYYHITRDYCSFIALGPGGIPNNFKGYLKMAVLRAFRLRTPFKAPEIPPELWLRRGYLESLPSRPGSSRPIVAGIAPQRQMTQRGPPGTYEAVSALIKSFALTHSSHTYLSRSTFEKHNTALFSRNRHIYGTTRYLGEICHAHPSDSGSVHLTLHPADVATVIETGWGERHPLARGDWWWRWFAPVPVSFTLIYAPRNEEELKVLALIIGAAAWWVGGVDSKSVQDSWS